MLYAYCLPALKGYLQRLLVQPPTVALSLAQLVLSLLQLQVWPLVHVQPLMSLRSCSEAPD